MRTELVTTIRRFNRTVTERVGALDEHYLARGRPLGASRLLWEIDGDGSDTRELRSRLELDSGYLSRLLRLLQDEALVTVETGATDQRVRSVRLTAAGRAERELLDRRSDELAWSLVERLDDPQREALVTAMATVDRLLTAGAVSIDVEDPNSADALFCIESYFAELHERFDAGFDASQSISADAHELVPPSGLLLVARLRARPVGCAALKLHGAQPAEVKRMWVSPLARGLGVGRRLLVALETHARAHGVSCLHLETNRSLHEAIALYRSAGYAEVPAFNDEPYAHHWFEKHLDRNDSWG